MLNTGCPLTANSQSVLSNSAICSIDHPTFGPLYPTSKIFLAFSKDTVSASASFALASLKAFKHS
jgi:hypothetical protein